MKPYIETFIWLNLLEESFIFTHTFFTVPSIFEVLQKKKEWTSIDPSCFFLTRRRTFGMERPLPGGQDLRRGSRRDSRLQARTSGRVEGFKGLTHTHGPSGGHGPAHARPGSLLESSVLARRSCTARPAGRAVNCGRAGGQRQARCHDQWPARRNPHAQSQFSQLRCSSVPWNENTGRTKFSFFFSRDTFNFKPKFFFVAGYLKVLSVSLKDSWRSRNFDTLWTRVR